MNNQELLGTLRTVQQILTNETKEEFLNWLDKVTSSLADSVVMDLENYNEWYDFFRKEEVDGSYLARIKSIKKKIGN